MIFFEFNEINQSFIRKFQKLLKKSEIEMTANLRKIIGVTWGRHVRNPGAHGFRVEPILISKIWPILYRIRFPTKFLFVPTPVTASPFNNFL